MSLRERERRKGTDRKVDQKGYSGLLPYAGKRGGIKSV